MFSFLPSFCFAVSNVAQSFFGRVWVFPKSLAMVSIPGLVVVCLLALSKPAPVPHGVGMWTVYRHSFFILMVLLILFETYVLILFSFYSYLDL